MWDTSGFPHGSRSISEKASERHEKVFALRVRQDFWSDTELIRESFSRMAILKQSKMLKSVTKAKIKNWLVFTKPSVFRVMTRLWAKSTVMGLPLSLERSWNMHINRLIVSTVSRQINCGKSWGQRHFGCRNVSLRQRFSARPVIMTVFLSFNAVQTHMHVFLWLKGHHKRRMRKTNRWLFF